MAEITTTEELVERHKMICDAAEQLMEKKNRDYGAENKDPFRNFRRHGRFGILVRLEDKLSRLDTLVARGDFKVTSETVQDTVLDIINYAILFEAYDGEESK